MRLDRPHFRVRVSRVGIHTLLFQIGALRYKATESESRQLAQEINKLLNEDI